MKIFTLVLSWFIVIGCSKQDVQLNEVTQIIQLKCTIGSDTLDTFNNTFTRVYYDRDVYTIDFSFTINEQRRIVSEINKVNFFALSDKLPHKNEGYILDPKIEEIAVFYSGAWADQFCNVLFEGKSKKIFWIDYASYKESDEYLRLLSVMNIIYEIVWSREEVKELPMEVWY